MEGVERPELDGRAFKNNSENHEKAKASHGIDNSLEVSRVD